VNALLVEILLKLINLLVERKKQPIQKKQIELVKKLNQAEDEDERKKFIKELNESVNSSKS